VVGFCISKTLHFLGGEGQVLGTKQGIFEKSQKNTKKCQKFIKKPLFRYLFFQKSLL